MGKRYLILALALIGVALTEPQPLTFIHPRGHVTLANPGGNADVLLQVFMQRHEDNRAIRVEWCSGATGRALRGAEDSARHPEEPITVRLPQGVCAFTATVYGAEGQVRHRLVHELCVAGGEASC